jgi:DNA-binding NtrC family response regulator
VIRCLTLTKRAACENALIVSGRTRDLTLPSMGIWADDLPARVREHGEAAALVASAAERRLPLQAVERAYILEVVRRAGGKKGAAAEILGLDRKTLYRRLQEYGETAGDDD